MKLKDGPKRKKYESIMLKGKFITYYVVLAGVLDFFMDFRNGEPLIHVYSVNIILVKLIYHICVICLGIFCFSKLLKNIDNLYGLNVQIVREQVRIRVEENWDEDMDDDEDELQDEDIEAYLKERLQTDEIVDDEVDEDDSETLYDLLQFDRITIPVVLLYSFIRMIIYLVQYLSF